MDEKKDWVDFREIKTAVSFQMVLDHYGLTNGLRKSKDELRGKCPLHQGEGERTFHVNVSKGAFFCFSCKARGNVLDFVAAMEQCSIRDAALKLRDRFSVEASTAVGERGEAAAGTKVHPRTEGKASPKEEAKKEGSAPAVINPPLAFQLRVDPTHEYGLGRGVTLETLEHFGAGACLSKGTFSGRFVIPLHDEQGSLVGYAGRSLDDTEPKYLFPSRDKGFYKSHLLFNLHRVLKGAGADDPVIVVEGFFDTMIVHQAGFPCVGLLGSSLSEQQEELLASHFNRVILLFDGDEAGRNAAADSLPRLARRLFVRVIDLADGQQPDQLTAEELRELIGK